MDGSSTVVAGPVQLRWDHFDGPDTQLGDHEIPESSLAWGLQRSSAPKDKALTTVCSAQTAVIH
jgi:hypothetical protein